MIRAVMYLDYYLNKYLNWSDWSLGVVRRQPRAPNEPLLAIIDSRSILIKIENTHSNIPPPSDQNWACLQTGRSSFDAMSGLKVNGPDYQGLIALA